MCTVLLPPGFKPTAANKHIISVTVLKLRISVPGRLLERLLLGKQVVRMEGEWNWLRIVSTVRIFNTSVEICCLATTQ